MRVLKKFFHSIQKKAHSGSEGSPRDRKIPRGIFLTKVATVATIKAMKAVGIKNLKNNLSRYLQEVKAGELIFVTDRDEVVAEISKPLTSALGKIPRWVAFINAEIRGGSVKPVVQKIVHAREEIKNRPRLSSSLEKKLKDIYSQVRGDRF